MRKLKCLVSYLSLPIAVPFLFLWTVIRNLKAVPYLYTYLRLQRIDYNQRIKFLDEMKGVH